MNGTSIIDTLEPIDRKLALQLHVIAAVNRAVSEGRKREDGVRCPICREQKLGWILVGKRLSIWCSAGKECISWDAVYKVPKV